MTMIRWPERVRRGGELKLFPRPSFTGSKWATDLDDAIKLMNQMLDEKGVGLVFKKVDSENGAHITAEAVDGNGLHGSTSLETKGQGERERVDWARLRVPKAPKIDGNAKGIDVGRPARMHILVHELVHCTGLTNDEHTQADVFTKSLVITIGATDPKDGSKSVPAIKLGSAAGLIKTAWEVPAAP